MANIEKKSRVILGILALIALGIFLATTFGSARWILTLTIIAGILGAFLIYSESAIISYFKNSKYKSFSVGDLMVWIGIIAGTALLIFSLSLIPTIGQILPIAIINFTTVAARWIASIAIIIILLFIFTPKQD